MTDYTLPIVIVAPTKKEARKGLSRLALPIQTTIKNGEVHVQPFVLIGNGSIRELEGLKATRYRTFFIEPDRVDHRIKWALEHLFRLADSIQLD